MARPEDLHPDLKILRLTLMRELETINQYQDFFDAASTPAVKELMGHLMFEEKEHVAELTEMLKRFDPDQLTHFEGTHAAEIGRGEVAVLAGHAAPSPERHSDPEAGGQATEALGAAETPEAAPAEAGSPAHAGLSHTAGHPAPTHAHAGLHGPIQADMPPLVTEMHAPEPVPPTTPLANLTPFTVGSLLGLPQP